MKPWYLERKHWLHSISGECCSTTQLMGKQDENDGTWTYALVMYHDGKATLKCEWSGSEIAFPAKEQSNG